MRKIGILAVAAAAFFMGCASWRWSGHPDDATPTLPRRVGVGGYDARGRGLGLHGAPEQPRFAVDEAMAGNAKPFLEKAPRTPEEHMKAGRAYLDKADRNRQEAASHYAMKKLYGENDPEMAAHCDRLIEQLSALAAQYEDISILQEKEAEELKRRTSP